jgi:hypothetical protein
MEEKKKKKKKSASSSMEPHQGQKYVEFSNDLIKRARRERFFFANSVA